MSDSEKARRTVALAFAFIMLTMIGALELEAGYGILRGRHKSVIQGYNPENMEWHPHIHIQQANSPNIEANDVHEDHIDAPADNDAHEAHGNAPADNDAHEAHGNAPADNDAHEAHGNAPADNDAHEAHGNATADNDAHEAHGNATADNDAHEAHGNVPAAVDNDAHEAHGNAPADNDVHEAQVIMQEHRQAGNDAHGDHIDAQAGNDALGDHIDAPADNDAHGQHGAMSPNINGLDHYEDWDGVVHRGHGTLIADNANQMA